MVKRYNHNYVIYKKYNIDTINNLLKVNKLPDEILYHEKDYKDSLRRMNILYELIQRDGNKCLHCGKVPTTYALGKDVSNRWHMDLYREEPDGMLMFTIDHVHPKSKGGENTIDNYQLLCKVCNEDKGDDLTNEPKEQVSINKKKYKKYKPVYITNKLNSLTLQVNGILNKLKKHKLVCIKPLSGFTVGDEYIIATIKVDVDSLFNTTYAPYLLDNDGDVVKTNFDFFITDNDYYLLNKSNNK